MRLRLPLPWGVYWTMMPTERVSVWMVSRWRRSADFIRSAVRCVSTNNGAIAGRRTDDAYPTTLPLVLGPRMYNERRNSILNLNFKIGEMRNQILSVHRHRPTTTTTNNTVIIIINNTITMISVRRNRSGSIEACAAADGGTSPNASFALMRSRGWLERQPWGGRVPRLRNRGDD